MQISEIELPSGQIIEIEHDDNATQEQLFNFASQHLRTTDDRGTLLGNAAKTFLSGGIEAAINVGAGGAQITAMGIDILDGEMDGINPNMGESVQIMSDVAQRWRKLSMGIDERMGIDPEFANSFGGQVLNGLGQLPVNIAGGIAGGLIGTAVGGIPGGVAGGLIGSGLAIAPQMTTEAIMDAERTLNKKYNEFSNEEMDDAALSALGYTALGGALEYVGLLKSVPQVKRFLRGQLKLPSGEIKKITKSLKREIAEGFAAEGFTEAAQGQLLDSLAAATYDDDRRLMSYDVLANRFNEFLVGGVVGGTAAGATGLFTKREQDVQNQNTKATGANSFDVVVVDDASGREFIIPVEAAANEEEAIKIAQEGLDAYETKSPDLTFTVTGATPSQGRVEQVIEEPEAQPQAQPEVQPEGTPAFIDYSNTKAGDTIEIIGVNGKRTEVEVIGVSKSGSIKFRRKDGTEDIVGLVPDSVPYNIYSPDYVLQAAGHGTRNKNIKDLSDSELDALEASIDEAMQREPALRQAAQMASLDHISDKNAIKLERGRRQAQPQAQPEPTAQPVPATSVPAPTTAQPQRTGTFQLPKGLRGAKSRYQAATINFASDFEKAVYIVGKVKGKKSARFNDYLAELENAGYTLREIQELRKEMMSDLNYKYQRGDRDIDTVRLTQKDIVSEPQVPTQRIPVDITDPDLIAYIEFLQQEDPQGGDIIAGASTPAVPFTNEQVLREAKFKKNDPRIIKKLGNEPLPRGGVRLNLNSAFTLPNGQRGMLQTVHPISSTGRVNYDKAHSYGSAYIIKDGKLSVTPLGRAVIGYGLNSKFPMASVDGDIVGTEPNLEANEILTFNPFRNSSFVDSRGRPVESFKGEGTVHGSKVYVRGTLNYAKQEPVRFTQKDMLDYLSGKTVKGKKLSFSKLGITGKKFPTDSDKAKEIRRMKKVVREKGELPFDSIQEDIVAGASTPTVSQETTVGAARLTADAIINASDQVIDAPISVETDPGEGGKVRSIGKMYLLPESEVLDFKDNNNIAPAAKRISKVLDLAFKQFPKFSKWYSSRLKMAMNILQQLDSDLKKPQDQFIVKVLLAITSNGNEVSPQTEESYRIYQYWKENNSIAVPSTQGTREGALLNHLKLVDDIIKKHGWKKLKTFMDKSGTVKDLRKEMQNTFGFTSKEASQITGGELVSEAVPFSLILGPKLGSFYNNLNGNFDTTTMDRWFMRTFGRTLGQQFLRQDNTEKTERFLNATNSILADPEYADILDQRILKTKETTVRDLLPKGDQVNSSDLKRLSIFFSKEKNRLIGGVKIEKSAPLLDELRLATNGLFKVGDSLAMLEAPKNGSHRRFIRRVMEQSLSDFNKANNLNFTPAEAQALLWYYEKLIHDSHGSRQKDEAPDYGSAANTLHRKITGRDSTRYRASDAVRRRGDVQPSGAVVSAAQQPSPPTGRRPESVGAAQPTSEQNTGQTQEEIVAGGFLGDFFDAGLNPPVDNSMRTPQEQRIEPTDNVNPEGYANERELEQAIEDEFGPIAKALGLARIIINTRMGLAASYNVTRNTIQFNPSLLIGQSKEYVRAAMREEIIHAVTHEVIKKQGGSWLQFFGQVGRDMNPKERRAVSDVYPNLKEDYDFGAEFYRMIIQQGSYGQITEQFSRNGPAMSKIQKLLKKVQSYMARLLKTIAGEKYQADVMIAQSAALLAQVDPSARPTNQKVIEEATESIAIQTGQREITAGVAAEINTPPSKKKNKEKLSFMDKYVNTVSRVLSKINPRIAQAFQSYFNTIEAEKNDAIKRVLPFVQKYNAIKSKADKDRLKQLLMYSPLKQDEQPKAELIAERDALLRKYDMYNDLIFGVQPVLSRLRSNAREQGIDVGFLESFFPRRVIDYKGLKDSLGETIADDINLALEQRNAEIETENIAIMERNSKLQPGQKGENLIPKIEKNSPEEALFIEDYIRKAGTSEQFLKNRGISIKIPREELSRRFELIQKEQLEFYDDVPSALESYITNMIVATRTTELMGRRYEELDVTLDPTFEKVRTPGTLSPIISELLESGEIDAEDVKTVRNIARMILNPAAKENPLLSGMRQASYISTLVEFTSTLSQLFDMPFVMYRNGLINTVRGLGMTRDFSLESFGYAKDRVSDEFTDERSFLNSAAKFGLKAVGFTKLDQIMKESNLAASYLQLRKLARGYYKNRDSKASKKFRLEIEQYNGAENVDATIAALKKGDRDNALVRNFVFAQLLKTQPMSKMQSVAAQSANPNVRFVYQMKSFMIAQLAYTRQEIFDDLFGSNSTTKQRAVALSNLTKLMGFMLLVGLPVDALKDFLAGRLGYLDDYLLNGMVRSFGISKYQFYQIKREGLGQAALDFITPITVQQGVDYTAELQRVMSGDKALTESKLVSIAPASDVINRLFGFTREKEMKEYRRRLKEGDVPFIRPPGSL